jgi:hypothetical protein
VSDTAVQPPPAFDEDPGYTGSRFGEFVAALAEKPYKRIWGAPGEPPLPVYQV